MNPMADCSHQFLLYQRGSEDFSTDSESRDVCVNHGGQMEVCVNVEVLQY